MYYEFRDFNEADTVFAEPESQTWSELVSVLDELTPQLQPSDQRGKQGIPIFDPKGTNALLTEAAASRGWSKVPLPASLRGAFGVDWDAGKGAILAEWQFSNYPFLWNNIVRTEVLYRSRERLPGMKPITALVVVTKSGVFPASNSTLYYEQACAQLDAVTSLGLFNVPIRLVGLKIEPGAKDLTASWNTYPGRYSREAALSAARAFKIHWMNPSRHGHAIARLTYDDPTPPPK